VDKGDKGEKVNKKYGNLIGYAINKGAFTEEGIRELKVWFETPEMVKLLEGVEPRVVTNEVYEREKEEEVVG
jgi:hypothetical protein